MRARNIFFMFLIFMLFIFAALSVVWIERVRPEKDNVAIYLSIFGFVTTNCGLLVAKITVDQGLQQQNVVLDEIHHKVNGGTERAMNQIREQHRIAMHDMNNQLNNRELTIASLQAELKTCREKAQNV